MYRRMSKGVATTSGDVGSPAFRALTIWDVTQISTSASQMVAMPFARVPATRVVTRPAWKRIGTKRGVLASEKNG